MATKREPRLVSLGYGKFARADRIYALVPLEPGERGEGRRTYVHVDGLSEPVVASRSEKAILAEIEAALTEAAGIPRRRAHREGAGEPAVAGVAREALRPRAAARREPGGSAERGPAGAGIRRRIASPRRRAAVPGQGPSRAPARLGRSSGSVPTVTSLIASVAGQATRGRSGRRTRIGHLARDLGEPQAAGQHRGPVAAEGRVIGGASRRAGSSRPRRGPSSPRSRGSAPAASAPPRSARRSSARCRSASRAPRAAARGRASGRARPGRPCPRRAGGRGATPPRRRARSRGRRRRSRSVTSSVR